VTEPTSGTDTTKLKTRAVRVGDHYVVNGQKIWTSRARALRPDAAAGPHHAARSVAKKTDGLSTFLVDMREAALGKGLTIRPDPHDDQPQHDRGLLRQAAVPAENLIGEEGKGFRYILDGMNAERILIATECIGDAKWFCPEGRGLRQGARGVRPAHRPEPGRAVPHRQGLCRRCARPRLMLRKGLAKFEAGLPCGEEANMAKMLAPRRPGPRPRPACRPTAASASPRNTTSSASSARRASTRSRRSRTNLILSYLGEHVLGMPAWPSTSRGPATSPSSCNCCRRRMSSCVAPGAAERMGLSYETLRKPIQKLIVCDISGYGADGPYRDKKAYDLLIQGEAGFLSVTGRPGEPAKAACSIADIAAGMYAYSNILAALINRGKTGRGCRIEISMLECMVEWMGFPLYYAFEGAPPPEPSGASHASIYPYGPFEVGGGKSIILGVQNEREWKAFCEEVLGKPELAADPRFDTNTKRSEARADLKAIIADVFSAMGAAEAARRLDDAGIANARVNTMADVWSHPQLVARDRWIDIDTPVGKAPALRPPGAPAEFDPPMGAVPALGQHNDAILAELAAAPGREG
jgi:itaconate CoA-transferase